MYSSGGTKLEPETTKKVKTYDLQSQPAKNDLRVTPELGFDELCLIFGNYWISTADLLNFRMVKKSWRDAATTTLLKRDACSVKLALDVTSNQFVSRSRQQLSKLTDLISNSPKFPTTDFRIRTPSDSPADYAHFSDLILFLKLHGDKIRTLGPHGWITEKCLADIFLIYLPSLESINLSKAKFISLYKKGRRKFTRDFLKQNSKGCLSFKSLWIGGSWEDIHYPELPEPEEDSGIHRNNNENENYNYSGENESDSEDDDVFDQSQLIHLLLSVSSKLIAIENVNLGSLGGILREGKGHLIRSFKYIFVSSFNPMAPQILEKLMEVNPKLATVTLNMDFEQVAYATSVNAFIDFFKETVQDLTFRFHYKGHGWKTTVKIPPMKHLKSITVDGYVEGYAKSFDFLGDDEVLDFNLFFVELKDGISGENYFPSLIKASLKFEGSCAVEANPVNFFKFKSDKNGSLCGSLPNVDILETDGDVIGSLYNIQGPSETSETLLFSEKFPNIRNLKINCGDLQNLATCCWGLCPKVEFMKIYGIQKFSSSRNEDAPTPDLGLLVDMFFTEFSLELYKKLKRTKLPPHQIHDPEILTFLRVAPSVCDLAHLKELTLQFEAPFFTEFASAVTGRYAFSKMPNAKFIISYDSKIFRRIKGRTAIKRKEADADAEAAEEL